MPENENEDFTQYFDAPVIEPVRGIGDVKFDRATFDYFASWASLLNTKRFNEDKADIEKNPALGPAEKAEAIARARRKKVQIFEVLDMQFVPEGIDKILKDAMVRAGGNEADWPKIKRRIGSLRMQQLAAEVCAEPTPTVHELRQSLREMLKKAHKSAAGVEQMGDEELMRAVREFKPAEEKGAESPLPGSPSGDADSAPITSSAATSSDGGSASTQAA